MAHRVIWAWTRRCSKSMHWHSYTAEIMIEGTHVDEWEMLLDFWIVKGLIWDFMDSFDHATMLSCKEPLEVMKAFTWTFERVIVTSFNPTAEKQAEFFYTVIEKLLEDYMQKENIKWIRLHSVRVHETVTGYAEATRWLKVSPRVCIINETPEQVQLSNTPRELLLIENQVWFSERIVEEYKNWHTWINTYNALQEKEFVKLEN